MSDTHCDTVTELVLEMLAHLKMQAELGFGFDAIVKLRVHLQRGAGAVHAAQNLVQVLTPACLL